MPDMPPDGWPLRPSRRATQDDVDRYPGIFVLGEPLGYCQDPQKWLPEWSLEAKPLPEVPEQPVRAPNFNQPVTKRKRKKANMSNPEHTDNTLTPTTPDRDELMKYIEAGDWFSVAKMGLAAVASTGEKKPIAQLVKYAIDMRAWAKQLRESLSTPVAEPTDEG